jgi:hypothetical protein
LNPGLCESRIGNRRSLLAALVASLIVHGIFGLVLLHWPSPAATATGAPGHTSYTLYSSPAPGAGAPGKLAPGDVGETTLPGPAPSGPSIVVPVAATPDHLGPALTEAAPAGDLRGPELFPGGGHNDRAPGTSNGGAATTFFGVPARGQRIVYVVDRSCSMGLQGAWQAARRELLASLQRLPPTAWFQVILYNSSPSVLLGQNGEMLPATPDNLRRAAAALEAQEPAGGTKHLPALQAGLALQPDEVFFLTDADDLTDTDATTVSRINSGRSIINTIELTIANRGHPDLPMQRLARDNHGSYRGIDLLRN